MMKLITSLCFIISSIVCSAQNQTNEKGQPYGFWKFDKTTYGTAQDGYYKIVRLSQYGAGQPELEEGSTTGRLDVKYRAGKASIVVYNFDRDSASVNDSIWNVYDTLTGKPVLTTAYDNGVLLWTKEYDAKGALARYEYTNYDADSSVYLTYMDHRVFKKEFYPPGKSINKITKYYPNEPLHFSNAEPVFNINYLINSAVDEEIKIKADTDVTITNFAADNNIRLLNKRGQEVSAPIQLSKGETYSLTIRYSSTPASYNFYDTIAIKTKGSNFTYKIICSAWCAHVDRNNAGTLQNIKLSIAKDRYLFIKGCGTLTTFSISDEDGKTSNYSVADGNISVVDLKEFLPGTYSLDISMNECNTEGGGINLKILE